MKFVFDFRIMFKILELIKINKGVSVVLRHILFSFSKFLSIDWCHLVDRHRLTAQNTTRKLVVPRAVCADQPNNTSFQHLKRIFVKSVTNHNNYLR